MKRLKLLFRILARIYSLAAHLVFLLILLAVGAPLLIVLALRFIDPPTTAFILARTEERRAAGITPAEPAREVVPLEEISQNLRKAVIASEDDRFYLHHGFDLTEIVDALEDAEKGRKMRGASTITQQTVKNLFLWEAPSLGRKVIEAYLVLYMELLLPKDRILELYLNLAEWGDGIFGAEAAAKRWFKKPASKLTQAEAARLAAILPAPLKWKPTGGWVSTRALTIQRRMNGIYVDDAPESPAAAAGADSAVAATLPPPEAPRDSE